MAGRRSSLTTRGAAGPDSWGVLGMGKGGSMAPLAAPPPSGKLERLGAE